MTIRWRAAWLGLSALLILALAGCAFVQRQVAADSEELLAEAGFQRHPIGSPPSRQLVQGADGYEFADPDFCRCIYVGGTAEYAELQRLRTARVTERDWIFRRGYLAADRTLWSAWMPEGLDAITDPIAATSPSRDR